jgi:hypothetical protein
MMKSIVLVLLSFLACSSHAFAPALQQKTMTSVLQMAKDDDDLLRWAKGQRQAGVGDRVVELTRPLGIVLNDDGAGNVYVETVAPKGNAARTGQVRCC